MSVGFRSDKPPKIARTSLGGRTVSHNSALVRTLGSAIRTARTKPSRASKRWKSTGSTNHNDIFFFIFRKNSDLKIKRYIESDMQILKKKLSWAGQELCRKISGSSRPKIKKKASFCRKKNQDNSARLSVGQAKNFGPRLDRARKFLRMPSSVYMTVLLKWAILSMTERSVSPIKSIYLMKF